MTYQNGRALSLVSLADVQAERISWLWPGYLARGKLHVIDGDPGLGKSTMTADLAARITTGAPWPDDQPGCAPAGVVLLSAEDGLADTIRPRLDAAQADASKVSALTGIQYWATESDQVLERLPGLPTAITGIWEAVARIEAAVVVVDPLMAYLDGDVNSYRDQDVRRALAPLSRMAEQTSTAVILIRHHTKAGGSNALYRGGGSIGIIGAARIGFTVARDPDDDTRIIVAATKANITRLPASLAYRLVDSPDHGCARVEWEDGPVSYTATDLLNAASESLDDRSERSDTANWLKQFLIDHGGSTTLKDILKESKKEGISDRTLRSVRNRLGITSTLSGYPARAVWTLDATESGNDIRS